MWPCPSCWPLSWSHRWCCGWVGAAHAHSCVWVMHMSWWSLSVLLSLSCFVSVSLQSPTKTKWLTQKQTNSTSYIPCYSSLLSFTINPLIASYCYCYTVVKDIWFFKVKVSCQVIHWELGCWLWDFPTYISYYETGGVISLFLLLHWLQLRFLTCCCFLTPSSSSFALQFCTLAFPPVDPSALIAWVN